MSTYGVLHDKNSMYFVGLDLGDKFSYITIVDQDGEMIEESRLTTIKASFQRGLWPMR